MRKLKDIAYGRSGDKGSHANVGIIAYKQEDYPKLVEKLTPERVQRYFSDLDITEVERFELPNLWALNFILHDALDGGGSVSLKSDSQGKGLAQLLLEMEWE